MRPSFLQSVCLALTVALALTATRVPAHWEDLSEPQTCAAHPGPDFTIPSPFAFRPTAPSRPIPPQTARVEDANTSAIGCLIFALPPPFAAEAKAFDFEIEEKAGEDALAACAGTAVSLAFDPSHAFASAAESAKSLAISGSIRMAVALRC